MIVVPALAHGEQREQPVVAGIIAGDIALAPKHMRERVDAEGAVIEEHCAPEEPDHQARPAGNQPAQHPERNGRHQLVAVQPHQFGIACEIGDLHKVGLGVPAHEDPADMTVEKALVARRVDVALGVGMQVMVPVFSSPPQHAFLRAALRQKCKNELKDSAR